MATDVKQIGNLVQQKSGFVRALFAEMDKVIVGQRYMLERMLVGLLSNGHILLEGVPGLLLGVGSVPAPSLRLVLVGGHSNM
ncbi:MAG: hypothetical protein MUO27_11620 [Sedimentisphaerales bacterium]|nr:hypothetical protein [Sedimentisphaerales bacterium]